LLRTKRLATGNPPISESDNAGILSHELSRAGLTAPTSMMLHSRAALLEVPERFWARSSKISNGRDHYAHGHIGHYAGNGCAFLCADAAGQFLLRSSADDICVQIARENEIAVSPHMDGTADDQRMRSLALEGRIDKGVRAVS
jgi:hypothetical protein